MGNSLKDLLSWHASNKELVRSLRLNAESRAMGQIRLLGSTPEFFAPVGPKTLAYRADRVRGGHVLFWVNITNTGGASTHHFTCYVRNDGSGASISNTGSISIAAGATHRHWYHLAAPNNVNIRFTVETDHAELTLNEAMVYECCGNPSPTDFPVQMDAGTLDPDYDWGMGPFAGIPSYLYTPGAAEKVWVPDEIPTDTTLDAQIADLPKCTLLYASPPGLIFTDTGTTLTDKAEIRIRPFLADNIHVHAIVEQTLNAGFWMRTRIRNEAAAQDTVVEFTTAGANGVKTDRYGFGSITGGLNTGDMRGVDGRVAIQLSTQSGGGGTATIHSVRIYANMGTADVWH